MLPVVFAAAGFGIVANMFIASPTTALIASGIVATGVPVYFAWRRWFAPAR